MTRERGGRWRRGWGSSGTLLALGWLLLAPHSIRAEYTETRDFAVQVDGKLVGQTQLTITDRNDGTTVVQNVASVKVKIFITYTYTYQGVEVWKGYTLQQLQGQCEDNLKKFGVQAFLDPMLRGYRIRSGQDEQVVQSEVWTTSYWKLPDPKHFNQPLTLIDADRGKLINGQLQYVGTEQRAIAGRQLQCYHFRVTGGKSPVDLWFDVHHRLVRQEFEEMRHQTVIELTNIRRK